VAVCFPSPYFTGMSNLGFQCLFHRTASFHGIRPSRFFIERNGELFSPDFTRTSAGDERHTLVDFDLILFTISFELDYIHIIRMLIASNLSPQRIDRGKKDPLVIAGGITVTANPLVLAPVVDVICRGDMEASFDKLLGVLIEHSFKKDPSIFRRLASLKGVFIPAVSDSPPPAAQIEKIEEPAHTVIVSRQTEFSNMFLIEIGRGCRNSCTFCMVRCAASPLRSVSVDAVLKTVAGALGTPCTASTEGTVSTGGTVSTEGTVSTRNNFNRVGLIAPVLTDHDDLSSIVLGLNKMGMRVSFSSLRADDFTPETAALLQENGQTTVTFAPETGSSELRKRIGKRLTDEALFNAVALAQEYGVRRFRYYIMFGLPDEREEDIAALVNLVEKTLAILRPSGSRLHVSVNPFIPKKKTPLEGFSIYPIDYYRKWTVFLKEKLGAKEGLSIRIEPLRHVQLQYYLSIGNEKTGGLLCRFVNENRMQAFVKSAERMVMGR